MNKNDKNEVFVKIHPFIERNVLKIMNESYPKYIERNLEDVKSEISLSILYFLDLYLENEISKEIFNLENQTIDEFFFLSVLGRVEGIINKEVKREERRYYKKKDSDDIKISSDFISDIEKLFLSEIKNSNLHLIKIEDLEDLLKFLN